MRGGTNPVSPSNDSSSCLRRRVAIRRRQHPWRNAGAEPSQFDFLPNCRPQQVRVRSSMAIKTSYDPLYQTLRLEWSRLAKQVLEKSCLSTHDFRILVQDVPVGLARSSDAVLHDLDVPDLLQKLVHHRPNVCVVATAPSEDVNQL